MTTTWVVAVDQEVARQDGLRHDRAAVLLLAADRDHDLVQIDVGQPGRELADVERRDRQPGRQGETGGRQGRVGRQRCRSTGSPGPRLEAPPAGGTRCGPAAARGERRGRSGSGGPRPGRTRESVSSSGVPEACRSDRRPRDDGTARDVGASGTIGVRGVPRSNQIRSPLNRSVAGSHGKRIRTSSETARPDGATPAHGPRLVPVSVATSKAPCGPITISDSAKALSGNAANSSP